jgi:hypothetical protein
MTAPRQGTDPASIRGIAILAVAVVLGFLLLGGSDELSLSTTSKSSANDPAPSTTAFTAPQQAPVQTTAPGAGAARQPAEVKVIVLNGSGGLAKGVAGSSTTKLSELGYQTLEPSNAAVAREVTVVLFAQGFQANAEAIKTGLGLSGTVELMETPTPEAKDANVVVLLGQDAASLVDDGATTTTTEG